jgi:hypothetical protein
MSFLSNPCQYLLPSIPALHICSSYHPLGIKLPAPKENSQPHRAICWGVPKWRVCIVLLLDLGDAVNSSLKNVEILDLQMLVVAPAIVVSTLVYNVIMTMLWDAARNPKLSIFHLGIISHACCLIHFFLCTMSTGWLPVWW